MQSTKPNCSLLLLTFTSLIFISSIHITFSIDLCNPSDKNTLLQISSHFNNASPFSTWLPNTDCCANWSGIECDTHGRVTMLAINNADDIVGEIPPVIGNLPFLQFLDLSVFPHLSGEIPQTLTKLTNLNHLDFSLNNLSGPIPDFISQLKLLNDIDLSGNSFSGPIPSSLGQLTNLQSANLGSNQLTGPIPASLGRIKTLVQLYIYINNLTGPLPPSLGSLPNLDELNISQNKLIGSIPPNFGSFKNPDLQLDLSFNSLTGPLPTNLGRVNITAINLSNNRFTGDASFMFGNQKTVLTSINLSNNQFKFDFSNTGLPPGLKNLDISHNMIYGSLPKNIGQLPLQTIDVSFNQLCGQIPTGRRLKRFSANKFSNNKCLCGLPLPACN
ncbi:hypothetical protein RND81_14G052900 [Saponaria officinalis]|uniref:Leucine-rich repeat-containing N-terminal plant-type domain-containing protein n=2 Tax=Saponaria officinalis TaxID=3572 RepID=A0AAW1GQJ8_SAPOF